MSARDHLGQQTSATVVAQSNREEAIVRAGSEPLHETERPEDWGWHGETGKKGRIGAWLAIVILFLFEFGNHEGNIENLFIIGICAVMVLIMLWDIRRRKNAWRSE